MNITATPPLDCEVEVALEQRSVGEGRERVVEGEPLELDIRNAQAFTRAVERAGGLTDRDLHRVEAPGHSSDLVAGADVEGLEIDACVSAVEVPFAERVHGTGQVVHRSLGA